MQIKRDLCGEKKINASYFENIIGFFTLYFGCIK